MFKISGIVAFFFIFAAMTGQASSLQERIDAAQPGEVVLVEPGLYRGNLVLKEGVALVGSGAEVTVLEGVDGTVIMGAPDAIVQGFTITGGTHGIQNNGYFIGIFENIIRQNRGSGIYTGGGDSLIVNNIIQGNPGKAGIEAGRSNILAVNNTIIDNTAGVSFWRCSGGTVLNNIITSSAKGVFIQEPSAPEIENNCFWANQLDGYPAFPAEKSIFLDPLFNNPAAGDLSLSPFSPLRGMGMPVEGLPEELTAGVGANLGVTIPIEKWRTFMEASRAGLSGGREVLEYELLDRIGYFRVTTRFPRPKFKVSSSTQATPIEEIKAFDAEEGRELFSALLGEEPPAVEVWGWEEEEYPPSEERYVMQSVFFNPESFFTDAAGNRYFQRETNFSRISILVPEGFKVAELSPPGEFDPATRLIWILNPARARVAVDLKLVPSN